VGMLAAGTSARFENLDVYVVNQLLVKDNANLDPHALENEEDFDNS